MSQSVATVAPKPTKITTSPETLTFEEYLFYQGDPEVRYELHKGKLIPMSVPSGLHTRICEFLVGRFRRYFAARNMDLIATQSAGVRTEENSSRIPDVVVCTQALWDNVCSRPGAGVLDLEEKPSLVVEVVSEDWRRDYIEKLAEYAKQEIPEYWIVDPKKQRIWMLTNPGSEDTYDILKYKKGESINSAYFPELVLAVDEVLDPPLVEELLKSEMARERELGRQLGQERDRAEEQTQRAERLAAKLRELNIDPDSF